MNIICLAARDWDQGWTDVHQFLSRLALRGHNVMYVDPLGKKTKSWRALMPVRSEHGLREVDHRLFVYSFPCHPLNPIQWFFSKERMARVTARLAGKLGLSSPVLLTMERDALPWIKALNPAAVVYHPALPDVQCDGFQRKEVNLMENTLIQMSDVVLAGSYTDKKRMERLNSRAYRLFDGVDPDLFAASRLRALPEHPVMKKIPHPCVGFIGEVGGSLNLSLIRHMACDRPDWQIVLAGPLDARVDVSFLRQQRNIHLIGYQSPDDMPAIMKGLDVAILPYRRNAVKASGDLSAYAYLCAGIPVVATRAPEVSAQGVVTARTPETFITLTGEFLCEESAEARLGRIQTASENTWDHRADELETYLSEALSVGRQKGRHTGTILLRPDQMKRRAQRQVHDPASAPSVKLRVLFTLIFFAGWMYYAFRIFKRLFTRQRPLRVQKILVTRLSRLGDMVVFMPTLAALRRRYPKATIVLAIAGAPPVFELLQRQNIVDEVRELSFAKLPTKEKLRQGWCLFKEGFDLVMTGSAYFIKQEAYFSGAPHRVGIYDGHPLQNFNNHLVPLEVTEHESDSNIRLVEGMSAGRKRYAARPFLPADSEAAQVSDWPALRPIAGPHHLSQGRIIGLHPGSQRESRRWPAKNFAALSVRILNEHPDVTLMFTGVPDEQALIDRIRAEIPERLRGRTTLAYQASSITSFLELISTFAIFICNDTGVMHLARAKGCPLIALLGPENDYRWGPYSNGGGKVASLRYAVPCAPCVRKSCEYQYCMRALSVKDVMAAVNEFLNTNEGGSKEGHEIPSGRPPVKRCSWRTLHDMGFELPRVTVTLTAGDPGAERPRALSLQQAERLIEIVRNQTYPNVEWIVCNPALALKEAMGPHRQCVGGVFDDDTFWRNVLAAATGEFIAVAVPSSSWHNRKISDDIAVLVRNPEMNIAASAPFTNQISTYDTHNTAGWGEMVFRRSYLEKRLQAPSARNAPDLYFWKHEPVYRAHQVLIN